MSKRQPENNVGAGNGPPKRQKTEDARDSQEAVRDGRMDISDVVVEVWAVGKGEKETRTSANLGSFLKDDQIKAGCATPANIDDCRFWNWIRSVLHESVNGAPYYTTYMKGDSDNLIQIQGLAGEGSVAWIRCKQELEGQVKRMSMAKASRTALLIIKSGEGIVKGGSTTIDLTGE